VAHITALWAHLQTSRTDSRTSYNAASDYHGDHPNDSKLSLNDIGSATGGAIPPHSTHDLGRSVDMRYMDPNGKTINSVLNADDNRSRDMVGTFKANGFNQNYSDNNKSYGTDWAPGHADPIRPAASWATYFLIRLSAS
jgi:hypothetical protein